MDTNIVTGAVSGIGSILKADATQIAAWSALISVVTAFIGRVFQSVISGGGLRSILSAVWLGTNVPKKRETE